MNREEHVGEHVFLARSQIRAALRRNPDAVPESGADNQHQKSGTAGELFAQPSVVPSRNERIVT